MPICARHPVLDGGYRPPPPRASASRKRSILRAAKPRTPRLASSSCLPPRRSIRAAFAASRRPICCDSRFLAALRAAWIGPEMKGAQRWFEFGFFSLQLSEVLETCTDRCMGLDARRNARSPRFPAVSPHRTYALTAAALLSQPDVGQTALLGSPRCAAHPSGMALRCCARQRRARRGNT